MKRKRRIEEEEEKRQRQVEQEMREYDWENHRRVRDTTVFGCGFAITSKLQIRDGFDSNRKSNRKIGHLKTTLLRKFIWTISIIELGTQMGVS